MGQINFVGPLGNYLLGTVITKLPWMFDNYLVSTNSGDAALGTAILLRTTKLWAFSENYLIKVGKWRLYLFTRTYLTIFALGLLL